MRFSNADAIRPLKSSWLTNIFFLAICVFITVIPFVPPEVHESSIPYYLHALIGIVFVLLCIPWWYFQIGRSIHSPVQNSDIDTTAKYDNTLHTYYSPTLISE